MKNIRIANRYAKAFFSLALELGLLETVKDDMHLIAQTISENKELRNYLLSPVVKDGKKVSIVKAIFQEKTNDFSLRFIHIIISKRRFTYIDYIAKEFINLYRNYKNITLVHLQTAIPINKDVKERLFNILNDFSQSEIELIEDIKKELIGGFVLTIGDKQYDSSLKSKILKLSKEFSVNIYEKGI